MGTLPKWSGTPARSVSKNYESAEIWRDWQFDTSLFLASLVSQWVDHHSEGGIQTGTNMYTPVRKADTRAPALAQGDVKLKPK